MAVNVTVSTDDLQAYLCKIEGGAVAVDLLKIGHNALQLPAGHKFNVPGVKLRLALDMEDCLDRFYGGYFSDWACGGQWNRAYQFIQLLDNAFQMANIEITAFFDGTLKEHKKLIQERNEFRQKTFSVLKHIRMIGTPPPKIWWLPPSGIRTCLRNAMRSINIPIVQTVNDHTMEILDYFHEQRLDGILGLSPDFIVGNVQRYFSSHDLRLSYKGSLETKEFVVAKFLTNLSLTPDHLPFVAALFGGFTRLGEAVLRKLYQKLNVQIDVDLEVRMKKIAEIVRNSPTNDLAEFIKHLKLQEFEAELRETVEYYQRRGKFAAHRQKYPSKKKVQIETSIVEDVPLASETSENDEMARKILNDVNNLVDDGEAVPGQDNQQPESSKSSKDPSNPTKTTTNATNFIYTLPGEVLKTSLLRHQRGIMDARIYQLLTKKEILLPQVLEDEQYRDVPSVHLFYRPARQLIYAILFNLYHQRYLCSKNVKQNSKGKEANKPEIVIQEWIWSPQNEYKRPEPVQAVQLAWSVPTIQRLWFGMAFEDKQRRMKAFLTVMRSDSPLMLNRGYVPQHMLVMACALRYIITHPERSVLTRAELDAFLATAFSPHLNNVEYTQEMVIPGVNLRGVYLATLFMQGVETASLANDACGVPLPWLMTNPWLIFDGKLFQLKLKISTYVQTLRELCDDHIDIVLKIERFRKAILEDVEHFLLPAAHAEAMYRFEYGKFNNGQQMGQNGVGANNSPGYGAQAANAQYYAAAAAQNQMGAAQRQTANQMGYYGGSKMSGPSAGQRLINQNRQIVNNQNQNQFYSGRNNNQAGGGQKGNGYQLKVGGVVVGSWGSGYSPRNPVPPGASSQMAQRLISAGNLSTRYNQVGRGRNSAQSLTNRIHRMPIGALSTMSYHHHHPAQGYSPLNGGRGLIAKNAAMGGVGNTAAGGFASNKLIRQNNPNMKLLPRRAKKQQKSQAVKKAKNKKDSESKQDKENKETEEGDNKEAKGVTSGEVDDLAELMKKKVTINEDGNQDILNGSSRLLASDLANEMCDEILKEDDDELIKGVAAVAKSAKDEISASGPKQILTKHKLISIGSSQEEQSTASNSNGVIGAAKKDAAVVVEVGQGESQVVQF